ncbi:hypothetical protein EVAR_6218_1 [Eumeta japonica]|uniref:Uncharacterized protein n=1 Tax=Eumeta variegata TaxID=151549 RepID=A0A4C1Z1F6_EUMVA|nr:hypothetical protein EVAR_6218_1 [Eumeta japonica]
MVRSDFKEVVEALYRATEVPSWRRQKSVCISLFNCMNVSCNGKRQRPAEMLRFTGPQKRRRITCFTLPILARRRVPLTDWNNRGGAGGIITFEDRMTAEKNFYNTRDVDLHFNTREGTNLS